MALRHQGSLLPPEENYRCNLPTNISHPQRPRPGRRRHGNCFSYFHSRLSFPLMIIILMTFLISTARAESATADFLNDLPPRLRRLAERGTILIDRRPLPPVVDAEILPRQDGGSPFGAGGSSSSSSSSTSSSEPSAPSTSSKTTTGPATTVPTDTPSSTTAIQIAPSSSTAASPLPSPFDTSLGSNFTTASCPDFFNRFLANSTFQNCHPFSLLLQTSNSFFQASGSAVLLAQALDASCKADLNTCTAVMKDLDDQLKSDRNCAADLNAQNPLVLQAHVGFQAYQPLYQASCLKSAKTGDYCFSDAMMESDNNSDSYPYYLALGLALPGGSRPTCDKCLQDTMGIFAKAAVDKNQPVSQVYSQAASQIDLGCGPNYVNSTVPVATKQGAGETLRIGVTSMLVTAITTALMLL